MGKYIKDVRYILRGGKTIKSIMHNGVEIYNIIDALVEENPDIAPIVSQYPLLRDALEKYPESAAAFQSAKDVITGQSFGNLYKKVVDGTISRNDLESWNIEFKNKSIRSFYRFEEFDSKRLILVAKKTAALSDLYGTLLSTGSYDGRTPGNVQFFEGKQLNKLVLNTYQSGLEWNIGSAAVGNNTIVDINYDNRKKTTSIYCKIGTTEYNETWEYNFGYGGNTIIGNPSNYVFKGFVMSSSKGIEHVLIPLSSGMAIDLITGVVYT